MSSTSITLEIEDQQVRDDLAKLLRQIRGESRQEMQDVYRQAAAVYLAFIRRRFVRASLGDGTWPDLAESTKLRRAAKASRYKRLAPLLKSTRKKTRGEQVAAALSGRKFAILRDTNTMFNTLTIGSPGNRLNLLKNGVEVGSNNPYIGHHDQPSVPGRPPQREIFVQPDAPTAEQLLDLFATAVQRILNSAP